MKVEGCFAAQGEGGGCSKYGRVWKFSLLGYVTNVGGINPLGEGCG